METKYNLHDKVKFKLDSLFKQIHDTTIDTGEIVNIKQASFDKEIYYLVKTKTYNYWIAEYNILKKVNK